MAAARAALGRLAEATPGCDDRPPPDLVVAAGGAWAVAPGAGRRARPRRRPAPARRSAVRPRPRPAARPARVDPRPGRAAGDASPTSSTTCWRRSAAWSRRPGCAPGGVAGRWSSTARDGGQRARPRCPAGSSSSTCRRARPPSPSSSSATRSGSAAGPALRGRRRRRAGRAAGRPARRAAAAARRADRAARAARGVAGVAVGGVGPMSDELNGHASEARPPGRDGGRRDPGAARRDLGSFARRLIEARRRRLRARPRRPCARRGRRVGRRRRADRRAPSRPAAERRRGARRRPTPRPGGAAPGRRAAVRVARPLARRHGDMTEPLETPIAGIVRERPPGHRRSRSGRPAGASAAIVALGGPTRGRLQSRRGRGRAALRRARRRPGRHDPRRRLAGRRRDPDPRPGDGRAAGSSSPAWRARSGATSSRPRRASGRPSTGCRRSRSSSSTAPSGGRWRRRSWRVLAALAGHEVAIVADPPMLVFDAPEPRRPDAAGRPASGSAAARCAGREGRWVGPSASAGSPAASTSRPGSVRFRRHGRGRGPARRPRALRLTHPTADRTPSATLGPMPATTASSASSSARIRTRRPRLGRAARPRSRGPATWSACGATSAPARPTSPRRSGPGSASTDTITSPSFVLMAEYEGRLPLFHIDLYRLADADRRAGRRADRRPPGGRRHARRVAGAAGRRAAGRAARRPDRRDRRRAAHDHARGPATPATARYLEAAAMTGPRRRPAAAILAHRHARRPGSSSRSARPTAALDGSTTWPAGYRHGETLLPAIERLLGEHEHRPARGWPAIVVGTGPGAFTGLRVGHRDGQGPGPRPGLPIVGVSTGRGAARRAARRPARRSCCCRPGRRTGSLVRAGRAAGAAAGRRRSPSSRRARRSSPSTSTAGRPADAARARRGRARRARRRAPPARRRAARGRATPTTSRRSCPST